ncbi:MAG: dihydroorotase, partial [Verrucomicrobiales bacterium]
MSASESQPRVILIRGAGIASSASATLQTADVVVEDGVITRLGPGVADAGDISPDVEWEGAGKVLLPGLFDMHVYLREPGEEWKETIQSGTEAAINGGVTGVVAMPNTIPAIDNGGMVQSILEIAGRSARIPLFTAGCITKDRAGRDLAAIADMREKGALLITEGGVAVNNALVMRRAMEYARDFDLIVGAHCEISELSGSGAMHEGAVSFRLGIPGMPACSEEICLARDLRLAQFTGARVHVQHVSTARGIETIRRYKSEGVDVSCAVTPHHLIFSDEDVGDYNTHFKMTPPLRTAEDSAMLVEAVKEGVFDVIATDHAPHA